MNKQLVFYWQYAHIAYAGTKTTHMDALWRFFTPHWPQGRLVAQLGMKLNIEESFIA